MIIRSYRSAFILLFLALLVLTVLAVSTNAYRRATRASLDLSADIIAEMSNKVVARTVGIFEQARGFLETDAVIVAEGSGSPESHLPARREPLFRILSAQLALVPQIQSLYVSDPAGNFVQVRRSPQLSTRFIERTAPGGAALPRPREQIVYRDSDFQPIARINGGGLYDPRDRPWYRRAEQDAFYISGVYRFASNNRPGVTLVRAVHDDGGELRYALGADVALDSISELLAAQRLAKGGVALIVDGAGRLVAFPYWLKLVASGQGPTANRQPAEWRDPDQADSDAAELRRVDDFTARWLVDAYRGARSGTARVSGNGAVEYTLTETGGARYLGHQQAFPAWLGADWTLFIAVPESSLLSSAARLFSESAVISLITLLVASFAVSALAMKLFQPLKQLVANTEHIRALRLEQVQRVRSHFREISTMDSAIWRMKQGLQSLAKFVPAGVAGELLESGHVERPEAQVRELAVLFTGIAALAGFCERLPPARITALLTQELDAFSRAILRRKGTLNNYLGESILAFWGAPLDCDDGAARACWAALECLKLERALFAGWDEPGLAPPENLFSVHLGACIVGALGSDLQMSWTAIGDNITCGWELRRLNRRYGTRIIVSGEARTQAGDHFWFRRLDRLDRLSREHPGTVGRAVDLFELVERREYPLAPGHAERIAAYEAALELLLTHDWARAERRFAELAEGWPEDAATRLMLERCRRRDSCWCPDAPAAPGSADAIDVAETAARAGTADAGPGK